MGMALGTSKKGWCIRCFQRGCCGCSHTTVASSVVPALLKVAAPSASGAKRLLPNEMPEAPAWSSSLLPDAAAAAERVSYNLYEHTSLQLETGDWSRQCMHSSGFPV